MSATHVNGASAIPHRKAPTEEEYIVAEQAGYTRADWDRFVKETAEHFAGDPNPIRRRSTQLSTDEIFAPLSPTRWTVDGLQVCPGRPTMLLGFGFSGKTLLVQALALYVASGRQAFGIWPTLKSRVLHIDFDQGRKATLKRYQRLAKGLAIPREELGDRLVLECHPLDLQLVKEGAAASLEKVCSGFGLVIIDALKGLSSGTDENDSRIREYVDVLTGISERTDSAFILLHHEGKGQSDDGRKAGRGSSSIFDAAGSVFRLTGGKDEPKRLVQSKSSAESFGGAIDDLGVVIEDTDAGAGVKITLENGGVPAVGNTFERVKREIVQLVTHMRDLTTKNAICERLDFRKTTVLQAIDELVDAGVIVQPFPRSAYRVNG
jgi:hypothetical protein